MKKNAVAAAAAVAVFASLSAPFALAASKGKAAEAPQTCDRTCLIALVDSYMAAIGAHDPSKAPLAADVKFVENVKRMKPGEGLWKSATALPTTFKIYVPD